MTDHEKKVSTHAEFAVTQKVVVFDSARGCFLLLRIADADGYFAQHFGSWDLAGGRPEAGESLEQALSREVTEEVGDVQYEVEDVIGTYLLAYGEGQPAVALGRLAMYGSGDIVLSHEHSEYRWMSAEEIEKDEECGEWVKQFVASAAQRLKEREYLNDAKRIYADFENYKRRQEERMKELSGMCAERFALDIIPVIDNFRAAQAHVPEEEKTNAWMTGITYIGKQLEEALATNGVSSYEAKEGEMFDPYLHEAVSQEAGGEEGKIVKMLQPGYKSGTRVIRPVKVIVG
jgi:molecular chaperone GrpE